MSYIYKALKPHLCTDVIGIIEDMVRWEGKSNWDCEFRNGGMVAFYGRKSLTNQVNNCKDGISLQYDSNFVGDKPSVYNQSNIKGEHVPIERCLNWWRFPYDLYFLVKINEHMYGMASFRFDNHQSSKDACMIFANNVQTLYDKHMDEKVKKEFFKLENLSQ